jgi:hypothetical protein
VQAAFGLEPLAGEAQVDAAGTGYLFSAIDLRNRSKNPTKATRNASEIVTNSQNLRRKTSNCADCSGKDDNQE